MAKRKIKVVRCGKCHKRYGAMKEGQKCPHCARARGAKTKTPKRRKNLSLVTADAAIDLLSRTRKRSKKAPHKRRTNRIPSRLKGKPLTTLQMVRMLPKKEVERIRRSVEKRKVNRTRRLTPSQKFARANPTAAHMWKKFHGVPSTKSAKVKVSKAFPTSGAWVLGPINYLKVRRAGKVQRVNFGPRARLVGHGKRLLAIANAQFKQHRGVNPSEHGLVPVEVGYEKIAPHLNDGYPGLTPWKHRFGEESGRMPCLAIDHEGFAVIKGGGFHIKADGIHD